MNEDNSIGKISYTFKSPVGVVQDRDFYLQQLVRWDYPTPGTVAMHVSSLPANDECPIHPNKVRATCYVIGFLMTPFIDPKTGEEHCRLFGCNSVDPCGMIPKWAINMSAKMVLPDWMKQYEKGCIAHVKRQRELEEK